MEIVCPACNARFALKVAKVPTTPFKAICGKCKQPFVVDPAKLSGGGLPTAGAPTPAAAPPQAAPPPAAASMPARPEPAPFVPPAAQRPAPAPEMAPAPAQRRSAEPGGTTSLEEAVAEAARIAAQRAAERVDIPLTSGGAVQAPAAPEDGSLAQAPIEEFSETLRLAMICDGHKQRQEHLSAIATDLGYRVHIPPTPREPMAWVQQNRYHLVLVHEEFKTQGPGEDQDVLAGLNRLHGALRRSMCVGLLGNNLRTLDNAAAFQRSVNFVLGVRDLGRARSIIRSAVADTDEFYRVFRETMKTLGKI